MKCTFNVFKYSLKTTISLAARADEIPGEMLLSPYVTFQDFLQPD